MAPVTDLGVCNFYRIKEYKDNLFQKWIRCPKELITAAKQSLEQGNIFTGVFLSTRGWLASMHHRSHDQGGLHLRGGRHRGRVCIQGGVGQTQPHPTPHPEIHGIQWDTVNKWRLRILLECILVCAGLKNSRPNTVKTLSKRLIVLIEFLIYSEH